MSRIRLSAIFLITTIALLVVSIGVSAAAPVVAAFTVNAENLTVGDPIPLTLTVTHLSEQEVIVPELESPWGPFVVVSQSSPKTHKHGDGTATTNVEIDVRLFAPGKYTTPVLTVKVANATGRTREVIAAPTTVEITSVLVPGDTNIRDLKPQAEISPWSQWTKIAGGSAVIPLLAVSALWLLRRRNNGVTAYRSPHETTLDELDRIEGLGLPDQGQFKEHYTLISNCMRTYMELAFSLSVWEHTTAEIHTALEDKSLDPELSDSMIDLLYASDIIKFSDIEPDVSSAYNMIKAARWLVEMTTPSANGAGTAGMATLVTTPAYEHGAGKNGRSLETVT